VRSLHIQNRCLLTKLLHRLFASPGESWPRWVWATLAGTPLEDAARRSSALCGSHWASLLRLLPLYRAISRVQLGDGARTAFWHDHWLPRGALSATMPELLSHSTAPSATV
jgi:hypothetical protein